MEGRNSIHHHRHHTKAPDEADLFRKRSFGAIKRWKILEKVVFYIMLITAAAIVAAVYYVYTVD